MTTIQTTATETPATSSPKCCKCSDRPATLRFMWPWSAVDYCCDVDRQTVINTFAGLGGPAPKFEPLAAPVTPGLPDTVPPPRGGVANLPDQAPAGAQQLTSSTAYNALSEGTIALVTITLEGGSRRFMLRRPGQGDVSGRDSELAIVLATLGLIPPLPTAAPPVIQQSTQGTPAGAASALASAGAVFAPPTPPNLAPPPPVRPPMTSNPMRQRVAGRHPPQIPPAVASGGAQPRFAGELPAADRSPLPASPAPPVSAQPDSGEPPPTNPIGGPAPGAVVEGETSKP